VRDPDRPENRLPERPRAVGGTMTDVRAPSPTEATRVTGPLLTADESDEADDDEPLFSDEQGAPPRLVEEADEDDEDDDDEEDFLSSSTVVENEVLPRADAATRVVGTPRSEALPSERTIVAPVDFAALNAPSAPTAQATDDVGDDDSSDFDAPTMVGGDLPDVADVPAPATDATFVGTMDVPPTAADATADQPRPIAPEMTTSTTAPAPTTTLSPLAYMGIGFAAASALGLFIAMLWAMFS
jgi:hypothetical protein